MTSREVRQRRQLRLEALRRRRAWKRAAKARARRLVEHVAVGDPAPEDSLAATEPMLGATVPERKRK